MLTSSDNDSFAFSKLRLQTRRLDKETPLQGSRGNTVRMVEGPLVVLAQIRPLQTKMTLVIGRPVKVYD